MKNKQIKSVIACVIIAFLLLVSALIGGRVILPAFADTTSYTNVLNDLQKDDKFNVADYPDNPKDYSIEIIQIAESTNGELFIYTYQPCQTTAFIIATDINMSLTEKMGSEINSFESLAPADRPKLYSLIYLNGSGTLCKYKVKDFKASNDTKRYYNSRPFINGVDSENENGNITNEKAFAVGKLYRATTDKNGQVDYECKGRTVVTIRNPYHGLVRYSDGFILSTILHCDSHYFAFSTDYKIDRLYSATITYSSYEYSRHIPTAGAPTYDYSEPKTTEKTLNCWEFGGNEREGWFAPKYEWKRILSAEEFIKDVKLNSETEEKIKKCQWVFRFLETEYFDTNVIFGGSVQRGTIVGKVAVLNLIFVTDGKFYNLGAVSDKVTGSNKPDNTNQNEIDLSFGIIEWLADKTGLPEWLWRLICYGVPALIVLAIALPVLSVVFPIFGQVLLIVLKSVGKALLWLLKGLLYVLLLPFKGIAALIRKIRGE